MQRKRNGTRISKRTNDNRIERTDTDCKPATDDDDCNDVAAAVPKMVPNIVGLMVGRWLFDGDDGDGVGAAVGVTEGNADVMKKGDAAGSADGTVDGEADDIDDGS